VSSPFAHPILSFFTEDNDLSKELKDGVILCQLANIIWPNCIKEIHPSSSYSFKHLENIDNFLEVMTKKRVCKEGELFSTLDLFDKV
jgi:hypothetical protein